MWLTVVSGWFMVYANVCIISSVSISDLVTIIPICTPASGVIALESPPIIAMSWTLAAPSGQLAGSATTPQSGKVYLKYPILLQELRQGLEPRLCRMSAPQGQMSVILDVDLHMQALINFRTLTLEAPSREAGRHQIQQARELESSIPTHTFAGRRFVRVQCQAANHLWQ